MNSIKQTFFLFCIFIFNTPIGGQIPFNKRLPENVRVIYRASNIDKHVLYFTDKNPTTKGLTFQLAKSPTPFSPTEGLAVGGRSLERNFECDLHRINKDEMKHDIDVPKNGKWVYLSISVFDKKGRSYFTPPIRYFNFPPCDSVNPQFRTPQKLEQVGDSIRFEVRQADFINPLDCRIQIAKEEKNYSDLWGLICIDTVHIPTDDNVLKNYVQSIPQGSDRVTLPIPPDLPDGNYVWTLRLGNRDGASRYPPPQPLVVKRSVWHNIEVIFYRSAFMMAFIGGGFWWWKKKKPQYTLPIPPKEIPNNNENTEITENQITDEVINNENTEIIENQMIDEVVNNENTEITENQTTDEVINNENTEIIEKQIIDEPYQRKIRIKITNAGYMNIDVPAIIFVEGKGAYSLLYLKDCEEPIEVTCNLKKVENEYLKCSKYFNKCHNSFLVNKNYIENVTATEVRLKGTPKKIVVSKTFKSDFMNWLHLNK